MANNYEKDRVVLEQEFEDLLDRMYFMYHYHPTHIPHYNITDQQSYDRAVNDARARFEQAQYQPGNHRAVNYGSDPNWCNGMPRNGGSVSGGKIK